MSMIDLEDEPDHLIEARHLLVKLHYFVIRTDMTEYCPAMAVLATLMLNSRLEACLTLTLPRPKL
jgi:hypothetical protein